MSNNVQSITLIYNTIPRFESLVWFKTRKSNAQPMDQLPTDHKSLVQWENSIVFATQKLKACLDLIFFFFFFFWGGGLCPVRGTGALDGLFLAP